MTAQNRPGRSWGRGRNAAPPESRPNVSHLCVPLVHTSLETAGGEPEKCDLQENAWSINRKITSVLRDKCTMVNSGRCSENMDEGA